jgi:hypothetical protein
MLYVEQAKIIGPLTADAVAAPKIRAIDQDAAHAEFTHFAKGDFLRARREFGHPPRRPSVGQQPCPAFRVPAARAFQSKAPSPEN